MKFAEALATGAPVLATVDAGQAVPDAPALVSDDAAAWADALVHCLADPADARRRGQDARAYALGRLSWQRVCEPLLRWVEQEGAR